jgi:hypothetical protein
MGDLHFTKKIALLALMAASLSTALNTQAEDLLVEDFLGEDEWSVESDESDSLDSDMDSEPESGLRSWLKPLSTQLSYIQDIDDDSNTHLKRGSVKLNYEKYLAQGLYLSLDWKLTHFLEDDRQAVNQNMIPKAASHSKWQQAWLQYSQGDCVGKLGRQSLVWGQVDGTFAVDVINPFDLTEPLLTDFSDVKRGQDMLRLDCYVNKNSWQVFYSPKASFNRLDYNTEFEGCAIQSHHPKVTLP